MEGDMMKGVFTRKDNQKQLTTTRVIQGDELIQVGDEFIPKIPVLSSINMFSFDIPESQDTPMCSYSKCYVCMLCW